MKFINFVKDQISIILFFLFLMLFISLVLYFDNTIQAGFETLTYINLVAVVLFCFYLTYQYLRRRRYFETINDILSKAQEDFATTLPEPLNYEQQLYKELILRLYKEYNSKLSTFIEAKRDNADFINYWVHEVKTPIAASRLVFENSENKSKDELLSIFEKELDSIENYVQQALYYSRTDTFSQDYLINEVTVEDLIKELIKKNAGLFVEKKIKLELSQLSFVILSDKKWLFFILDQILLNALKYTKKSGIIKIYGELSEKERRIIIEDNGIGIKTEDLDRVFEKGFTGFNGRQNLKSTGIGLYLAKNLALKLGHDITLKSVYSEYTKVTLHFPKLSNYFKITN